MPYAIDFYVNDETGFPYAYRLYEPEGSARPQDPEDRDEMQFVPDSQWDDMITWCEARGIGPFDTDYLETEISADLAFELKVRWDDPASKIKMSETY